MVCCVCSTQFCFPFNIIFVEFRNKGQIITAIAISRESPFVLLPLAPKSHGWIEVDACIWNGLHYRRRDPEVRKPGTVIAGSSIPCVKGGIAFIIIDKMHDFPWFQRKTLYLQARVDQSCHCGQLGLDTS